MDTNLENIKNTYDKYISLLKKFFPESHDGISRLEADLGERLALCPRDTHPNKGGVPGGLISFALMTANHCKAFRAKVDAKKLARVALIHELGRLGDPEEDLDLFIPETSDWHREKLGRHYKYNENCPKMSVAHRTLFYLAHYGFYVDREEWISLATSAGFQYDENRFYANEVLPLAQALHTARTFALSDFMKL
jgi:hypothetical protein|tara:strand:+ start:4841 stop:5422 length:582 start_codon:yes stop_codon:yes gene_type:complete